MVSILRKTIAVQIIKSIFQWYSTYQWQHAQLSPHSHCLLRIYFNLSDRRAAVIASQLRSNQGNTGIGYGFPDLVTKIMKEFPELEKFLPEVTWVAHYGLFSEAFSYENLSTEERFRQIHVKFNDSFQVTEVEEGQIIALPKIPELIGGVMLESVEEVLAEFNHE